MGGGHPEFGDRGNHCHERAGGWLSRGVSRPGAWSPPSPEGQVKESFGPRKENSLKGPLLNHLTS